MAEELRERATNVIRTAIGPGYAPAFCRGLAEEIVALIAPEYEARLEAEERVEQALRERVAALSKGVDAAEKRAEQAEVRLAEAEAHEQQTHAELGAVLGTDDSLLECAKRIRAQLAGMREALERISDMCDAPSICICGRPTGLPALKACADAALAVDAKEPPKEGMSHEEWKRGLIYGFSNLPPKPKRWRCKTCKRELSFMDAVQPASWDVNGPSSWKHWRNAVDFADRSDWCGPVEEEAEGGGE